MSWLSKVVSNPIRAITDTVQGVASHPLAYVNPTTWIGTAVASGGNTQVADQFTGAQTAGGILLGGAYAGPVLAGSVGAGGAAGTAGLAGAAQQLLSRLTAPSTDVHYSAQGAGVAGDVTAPSGDDFNLDNAAPGIALALLGLAIIIAAS